MISSSPSRTGSTCPPALIVGAVCLGVITHLAASFNAHGSMAAVMVLMALACLSCLVRWRDLDGSAGAQRMCAHFMIMTILMIAIHVAWIVMGSGAHGHAHGTAAAPATQIGSHTGVMLAVIGVEFVCLVLGAVAMRRSRALGPAHTRTV